MYINKNYKNGNYEFGFYICMIFFNNFILWEYRGIFEGWIMENYFFDNDF